MRVYPWTIQVGRDIAKDWGGSPANKSFVYGDTFTLGVKVEEFNASTNAYAAKDFTADGGNPLALRVLIRKERDSSSTLYSFQDVYNGGYIVGFADLPTGQVEWEVSLSDSQIKTDLDANDGQLSCWLEISYLDANNIPSTLTQQTITIFDQVDDGAAGTPPPSSPTYLTAAEIAAGWFSKGKTMFWAIASASTTTPPTLTGGEDKYIIPTGATGAWSGQTGKIAVDDGSWTFYTPSAGWTATVVDEVRIYQYISGAWTRTDGFPLQVNQVAHGLSADNVVYNNAGTWTKSQADDADTLGAAIVVSVEGVDDFTVQYSGVWQNAAHGFTVGEWLLVSPSTAGLLTETAPTGITEFSHPMVYVHDADTLIIQPQRPFQAVERSNDVNYRTVTAASVSVSDADETIKADSTSNAVVLNFPDPSSGDYDGFRATVIWTAGANTVTLKSPSGNIQGVLGTTGVPIGLLLESVTVWCDGTDYWFE